MSDAVVNSEALHRAADILGRLDEDGHRRYGISLDELDEFIQGSNWTDVDESGPERQLDSLALAMGISIGIIAAQSAKNVQHGREEIDDALMAGVRSVAAIAPASTAQIEAAMPLSLSGDKDKAIKRCRMALRLREVTEGDVRKVDDDRWQACER